MAEYIVLECMDCKHKDIYVNGKSDGKRCERCNSGMYFPIDSGNKSELMTRYNMREQRGGNMGLSRLSKKCRECKHIDTCEHKRMEALAYISEASSMGGAYAAAPIMQSHDYRDIKIDVNTTVTIDLEEMKKKLEESMYPNFLQYGG